MHADPVVKCLTALVLSTAALAAHAVPVLVFDNGSYVDTSNSPSAESDTLQAALAQTGNPVTTFTATSAAGIAAALQGQTVLVIPEQELGALVADLDEAARNVLRDFVAGGGGLVIAADYQNTLNTLFGYSLSFAFAAPSALNPATAAGTTFAGGPSPLPTPSETGGFLLSSLPAGARSIYDDGTVSTVTLFNFGEGQIVHLGWDFFNAAPLGTEDGGWLNVLDRAVNQVSGDPDNPPDPDPLPEPGSIALLAVAAGALAASRRKRKA